MISFQECPKHTLGDGVFTTLLKKDGILECWEGHQHRLKNGIRALRLGDVDFENLRDQLNNIVPNLGTYAIRITIVRYRERTDGFLSFQHGMGSFSFRSYTCSSQPCRLWSGKGKRHKGPLSHIKTLSYTESLWARFESDDQACDEALLWNTHDHLVSATCANVFIVQGDRLLTPPLSDGCVSGIMRSRILKRFPVIVRSLRFEDVDQADAIFLTNSLIGVRFCSEILGTNITQRNLPTSLPRALREDFWP